MVSKSASQASDEAATLSPSPAGRGQGEGALSGVGRGLTFL